MDKEAKIKELKADIKAIVSKDSYDLIRNNSFCTSGVLIIKDVAAIKERVFNLLEEINAWENSDG